MFENDLKSKTHEVQAEAIVEVYRSIAEMRKTVAILQARVDELERINDQREDYEHEQNQRG